MNIVVFGSSGFIGGQLVKRLKAEGHFVVGADIEYPEHTHPSYFMQTDLRIMAHVMNVLGDFRLRDGIDQVYQLAADMGGASYIFTGEHDADIMHNSASINLNVLDGLRQIDFKGKVFYSSSACMYPQELQTDYNNKGLKESDGYPGNPDSEYGWEKLFSERLYLAYQRNYGLNIRIARFHNIYGPEGTYKPDNGVDKSKAPAAMCRKVILCPGDMHGYIFIWGTGHQTRSFLYIDDCLDAVRLLMDSDFKEPINIGSEEMVTINQLAEMALDFKFIDKQYWRLKHEPGPTGVMGRNSCNDLIREKLNWEPKYSLKEGLKLTYDWIKSQYEN